MNWLTSATTRSDKLLRPVEHSQDDTVDRQPGIERRADPAPPSAEQLRQALEREELALQRHQDRVRRGHRVDGDKVERRRAIDQHIGVVGVHRGVGVQPFGDRIAERRARPGVDPSSSSRPERSIVDVAICSRGTAVGTTDRATALRRSARHRSSSCGCGDRCQDRWRHCLADRDRRSARVRRSRPARCRD